jgi:hypothetical protein
MKKCSDDMIGVFERGAVLVHLTPIPAPRKHDLVVDVRWGVVARQELVRARTEKLDQNGARVGATL